MSTIVTRAGKGSALSHAEVDANFTNLNTDKVEGQAASVDSEIALFSGLGGKTIKRATTTGVLKATSGVLSAAAAGTDFQAPITASGVLKGAGAGSVSAAVAGTDYLAPPAGTAILKANSGGALANAVAGTDYLAPPSGTSILKANSGGALANAVAGTDFIAPGGALGTPSSGTLSNCTVDGTDSVGFRNSPVNSQSAAYTTVLADAGKIILHPSTDANARTFTIPANATVAYPIGTVLTFINLTSQVVSIAITTDTMFLAGSAGTTGTRSLAQYGVATAIKLTSTTWIISGTRLT